MAPGAAHARRSLRSASRRAGAMARMSAWCGEIRRGRLPAQMARRWPVLLAITAGLVGCLCAIYLSWRSTGRLTTVPWMPETVGRWADEHGRFRNLPAYFLLSLPFLLAAPTLGLRARTSLALAGFGAVLELAEYFVPIRMVEWQDIAWSWAGVAGAWGAIEVGAWLRSVRRARKMNTKTRRAKSGRKALAAASTP